MLNNNFYALLHSRFSAFKDKVFLQQPDGAYYTYGEIDAFAMRMAGALVAAGARPGDRIVAQVEKSPANVALYLGAMRAGLVYTPLNTAYMPDEAAYFLKDAAPAVFVCDPAIKGRTPWRDVGVAQCLTLGADSAGSLISSAQKAAPFETVEARREDDLASILYTSGTTGRSKGAMLSHGNLASNALALNALWAFAPEDTLLHALPIFHIHGLFVALHTAMLSASTIIFHRKFDTGEIIRSMDAATVMMGVPTFYTRLLADPDFTRQSAKSMRLFISGSAPLSTETFLAFETRTGHQILERYGMSETGMIASNPLQGERVAGTVGFALPGVDLRIRDETGAGAAPDAPGGVEVRGPNVFQGYWNLPGKTAEEFTADGYFKTGDIGVLDRQGRLSLIGRSKDMIIAGGYNIYPKEIEQILDSIPGVAESAVIGAPHPDMGEGVAAVLVADQQPVDDAVLQNALSALAKFKRPRKFFWVDALPRNAMGKVQKQKLRALYKNAFAL